MTQHNTTQHNTTQHNTTHGRLRCLIFAFALFAFSLALTACPQPANNNPPTPEENYNYAITMLSSQSINTILVQKLGAKDSATAFKFTAKAPAAHLVEGESKYRLSEKVEGETPCWAWREGNTIYCYAKGFTDSNKKFPLKSAIKGIFTKVKIVNHTQVDTVSGATTTADALKAAIEDALTQARGGE